MSLLSIVFQCSCAVMHSGILILLTQSKLPNAGFAL